jgi:hypothetical protein
VGVEVIVEMQVTVTMGKFTMLRDDSVERVVRGVVRRACVVIYEKRQYLKTHHWNPSQ